MTAQIKIGTCSWTDPALTGHTSVYPSTEMTAEERLRDALLPLHSGGKLAVVLLRGIRSAKGLADLLGVF